MLTLSLAFAGLAAVTSAVAYGTDVFAAIVLRPAFAGLDDAALVQAAGRIHQYADQRMPFPGAAGTLAAAAAALTAGVADHPLQAGLCGGALLALLAWLSLYILIAAPINHQLTHAAAARETRPTHGRCRHVGTASSAHVSPYRPPRSRYSSARWRSPEPTKATMYTRPENTPLAIPDSTTFVVIESASDNDGARMTFTRSRGRRRGRSTSPFPSRPSRVLDRFGPESYPSTSAHNGGLSGPESSLTIPPRTVHTIANRSGGAVRVRDTTPQHSTFRNTPRTSTRSPEPES